MKALAILLFFCSTVSLFAQGGVVVRAAEELGEVLLRRGGTEAVEELAKIGGQKAVQELMEQAMKEGGEALMRQTAKLAEKHGVLAVRALHGAPGAVVKAVDGIPAELAENGLRAIVREPAVMQGIVKEFGSTALETAAKHPGLAGPLSRNLGSEGLDIARRVTTDEAKILARHADDIAKLPVAERTAVMDLIRRSPGKVLAWMERHPKLLLAGGVTAGVVLARKEIFGEGETPGFLERVGGSLYNTFKAPVNIAVAALCGIIVLWAALKMRRVLRAARR
jgi:hypothetical protein